MKPAQSRRPKAAPTIDSPAIDIMVQSPLWAAQRGIKSTLRRAVLEAAAAASAPDGEVAIVLTDDSTIHALNRDWRNKNAPTNVLSFPTRQHSQVARHHLGDIVIAYQTTAREAEAERKPFKHHLAHLAVHGFLHLVGYDHEVDDEAEVMESLEILVLARMRVPNPYIARDRRG